MATGEKKTQDIQKATEALMTDLLLATTQPATGNPENKNISVELLKAIINKEVEEKIKNLSNNLDEKVKELIETDKKLITKTKGITDIQCGKETCDFSTTLKSKTVKFPRKMLGGSTPAIIITIGGGSSWAKGVYANASTVNNDGFDLNFVCDSGSGSVSVSWAAFGRE